MLFVRIIRQLAPVLSSLGLQPLLCAGGASGGTEFAREVRSALLEAAPSAVIVEGFMGAEKMADIFLHVSALHSASHAAGSWMRAPSQSDGMSSCGSGFVPVEWSFHVPSIKPVSPAYAHVLRLIAHS